MIIPAITLWQPWASLIACGAKVFETRAFPCPKRLLNRLVAIHAAKRPVDLVGMERETVEAIMGALKPFSVYRLPLGVVVCTAIITGCEPADRVQDDHFGNYAPWRWAWRIGSIKRIDPPIPAKGQRMIGWPWEMPR